MIINFDKINKNDIKCILIDPENYVLFKLVTFNPGNIIFLKKGANILVSNMKYAEDINNRIMAIEQLVSSPNISFIIDVLKHYSNEPFFGVRLNIFKNLTRIKNIDVDILLDLVDNEKNSIALFTNVNFILFILGFILIKI
jgi:hypothetical protein